MPNPFPPYLPVYHRSNVVMVRGEGVWLFDDQGKRYLDFAAGIAVNALGHCHPHLTVALKAQADTLWHCSNFYRNPWMEQFAERLVKLSFADTAFFCSSGAEAVECGIKMIRRARHAQGKYRILTFEGGFHGRTLAGISAGGNAAAREGFHPLVEGFDKAPFNDLDAARRAITKETAGILVEPILGEGGVKPADKTFLQGLRALADAHGLILFFDEVQCGMGRAGTLFAYEQYGVAPDILTLAKGIGNGFPLAACLATEAVARHMTPGSHGSTYGSNPLAMAVGNAVLDVMLEPEFMPRVRERGEKLLVALKDVQRRYPKLIAEVRGRGLMIGMQMAVPHREFAATLRENGLLVAPAYDNVLRFVPPLIIDVSHVEEAARILQSVCEGW